MLSFLCSPGGFQFPPSTESQWQEPGGIFCLSAHSAETSSTQCTQSSKEKFISMQGFPVWGQVVRPSWFFSAFCLSDPRHIFQEGWLASPGSWCQKPQSFKCAPSKTLSLGQKLRVRQSEDHLNKIRSRISPK